ncbi:uncharacterized protein C8R40DRAFT_1159995 [Lentinula edodes]|uniref:uncharacterized protein n=1 Tax=Lentinula edodes TaxID=5353 RepID=UPI001E8E0197|nr:uncharacterized protein C8R40DRAFT_1159995 [Lentinula edodes]KAH7876615.1 hypothetical protein C8R40DRAFT_1159995 [Lentinula edodes]
MNLKRIAEETIEAVESGSFQLGGTIYDLKVAVNEMRSSTEFWSPDSKRLASWAATRVVRPDIRRNLDISLQEISSLEGSRFLAAQISAQYSATTASSYFSSSAATPTATPTATPKIGLLNFASATKPGGGFLSGASAQEESIARSSTLYYSLTTRNADEFYKLHKRMKHNGKWNGLGHTRDAGFYTHAMIYSPSVLLFRDDTGSWLKPLPVDVLTSAAVNAGDIRTKHHIKNATKSEKRALEVRIEKEMKERMARILHIFALKGVRNLVLGSFGTGVFKNNVEVVARLWKELLIETGAPFEKSFDRVVFAVLGKETYETFEDVLQLDS